MFATERILQGQNALQQC